MNSQRRSIIVAGSSGLIGSALLPVLRGKGHTVRTLVRRPATTPDEIRWDPAHDQLPDDALDGVDLVVNLAGVGVGDHRWTASYREQIRRSRTSSAGLLATRLAQSGATTTTLLQASAIGLYGDRGDEVLTESSTPGEGFLAGVVRDWEAASEPARVAGLRVVNLRSGIVLSGHGGAMGRLLPLVKAGVGGPLGSGRQFWSWITLEDEIRAICHLMEEEDVVGPVNLTAPAPSRNRELVDALGSAFGRPTVLKVPSIALKVALGDFSSELTGSQRVHPEVLGGSGFTFAHPDISAAARWVAQQRSGAPR